MRYRIINSENDDLIAFILQDIEEEFRNNSRENIQMVEVETLSDKSKGVVIQAITFVVEQVLSDSAMLETVKNVGVGVISSAVYDILKERIRKVRRLKEYESHKKLEIETTDENGKKTKIKITLEEIMKG